MLIYPSHTLRTLEGSAHKDSFTLIKLLSWVSSILAICCDNVYEVYLVMCGVSK